MHILRPTFKQGSLSKGKACVNCRRRKIKCDGGKPICGPCAKYSTTFGDCEYTEDGISRAQILEEQISILQDRIEELERPSLPNRSRFSPSLQRPVITRRHSTPTPQISLSNTMRLGPLLSYFYSQQTSGSSLGPTNSMPTELPFIVLQALVHNFLHNASCFGFFLDTQAFHDAITSAQARNLPPVLLNVMYLWGVHLAEDARITAYEPAFLAHALRSTAGSLSGTHPRTVLHSLQASVLLAYYFIRNARFLEGRYHTSAAVSIAVSSGLHRIRAPRDDTTAALRGPDALPAPKDAWEEGEQIIAFWNVLTLNNCWAGTDGSPSNVSYGASGLKIDTPWPLDRRDYVERPHLLPLQSSGTVYNFLDDVPDNATSDAALHAKAGILFEETTKLTARYRTNGIPLNDPEYSILDRKIDGFTQRLPTVNSKGMLVVHMLAYGSTIQLHKAAALERPASHSKLLAAAQSVVGILEKTDVSNIGLIDPILAPLWTTVSLVFIAEIAHQRKQLGTTRVGDLTKSLNVVIAAMEVFAPHCRLMTVQLDAVRRAYHDAR
ncbi:hypothetical protein DFH07DRAFT_309457 [Mycena maculata]|uniref:Zn(2)-C6 fungal-type domain-containing protein n=1 Tax=Mycena maculata TaxID=230809 RepID=A0AAD7HH61_9AGAR|nr:hypothetical protein DFH07DRAFT_309457 [Mycena maculata]